jgi:prepilin-type processing-associated H-X9-DG protein
MRETSFTLIELLVVIATVALLMAILAPSLQNSRERAKAVLCSSNIKQLAFGLIMYETEHHAFPYALDTTPLVSPPGGYPGNHTYDRMGWWWFNYITDYSRKSLGRNSILWCPSRNITDLLLKTNALCSNYGVNLSICKKFYGSKNEGEFEGTSLRSADISRPGETLLILDSGYSMINLWHATDTPLVPLGKSREDTAYVPGLWINKKRDLWPGQEEDAINGRHPNKTVNVGFVDGHVEKRKAESLSVEKIADEYKNKIPLWQPK